MIDLRMSSQEIAQQYKEKMLGKRYRHFKGGVYTVTNIVVHSETAVLMVIYENFDNPSLTWARPLYMFLSEVDRSKYPNVEQKYRFEQLAD